MIRIPTNELEEIRKDLTDHNSYFSGATILLLGGSGFLGNIFKQYFLYLNRFLKQPCHVISVDNYIKGITTLNQEIDDVNLTNISHDLVHPLSSKIYKFKTINYILNCSGNASPRQYQEYPIETMRVSSIGTDHLLELALFYNARILNFSSSEVLGTPRDEDIPTGEHVTPCVNTENERAPYDVSKMFIESLSWSFRKKHRLQSFVVRPFNIVGFFHPKDYRVIPNYLNKLFKNEKIEVYKPGTQTRTFCYYTDFVTGVLKILVSGCDHIYHLGNTNNEISMIDLAKKLAKIAGKEDLVELVETPSVYKHEPKRRCPSVQKIKEELGYEPKIGLQDMLERIYNWAKENY